MLGLLFLILVVIVIIFSLYAVYKLLSKKDYVMKGLDIVIYQVGFILAFHVWFGYYYNSPLILIPIYILILLLFSYLLKVIKTTSYINLKTIILYFVLNITNLFSLGFVEWRGFGGLVAILAHIGLSIGIILYLLILNLIRFLINKNKNIMKDNLKTKFNKLTKIIIIIFAILPYICGFSFKKIYYLIMENEASNIFDEYLEYKYGKDTYSYNYKDIECYDVNGYDYACSVDVLDKENNFTFTINIDFPSYIDDNYIVKFYENKNNENFEYWIDLEEYLERQIENKINNDVLDEFDAKIYWYDSNLEEYLQYIEENRARNLPSIEEIVNSVEIENPSPIIYKKFNSDELDEFTDYLINLYERLFERYNKYDRYVNSEINYNLMQFYFKYENPFDKKDYEGNLLIYEYDNYYLIYIDKNPIKIEKK